MKTTQEQDPLKNIFAQLPKEKLPDSFRSVVMQQIMAEAVRLKKRNERLLLAAVIAASAAMLALGVWVFVYVYADIPKPAVAWPEMPSLTSIPLYLYTGLLSLLLLFSDYQVRKAYRRRHKDRHSPV